MSGPSPNIDQRTSKKVKKLEQKAAKQIAKYEKRAAKKTAKNERQDAKKAAKLKLKETKKNKKAKVKETEKNAKAKVKETKKNAKAKVKETKKKLPSYDAPQTEASANVVGKKAFAGKDTNVEEVIAPKTEKEIAELQKTEQEVTAQLDVKLCIVHKGPIKGTSYSCPQCSMFYCFACASALSKNGDGCWSCGHVIDLGDVFTIASTINPQPPANLEMTSEPTISEGPGEPTGEESPREPTVVRKAKFYCDNCSEYRVIENPDFDAWVMCPVCQGVLTYVKYCLACGQPIALSKELFAAVKGSSVQCSACGKYVRV